VCVCVCVYVLARDSSDRITRHENVTAATGSRLERGPPGAFLRGVSGTQNRTPTPTGLEDEGRAVKLLSRPMKLPRAQPASFPRGRYTNLRMHRRRHDARYVRAGPHVTPLADNGAEGIRREGEDDR